MSGGPRQRETLDERTKLDEAAVETLLRFESADNRTHEGKFNYLIAQEKHVLTPCVSVTLSTQKLNTFHSGYQRPKVPVQTMLASGKHGLKNAFASK